MNNTHLSPEFSSAEAQRLFYLKQLGVFSCYPRFVLPGALPSEACELPEPVAMLAPTESAKPIAAQQQPGTEQQQEARPAKVLDEVAQKPAGILSRALEIELNESRATSQADAPLQKQAAPTQRPQINKQQPDTNTDLQFQMLLIQADKGLVICTQIPMLARQGLTEKEQRLLHNILLWLGCKVQAQSAPRRFTWPIPGLGSGSRTLAGKSLNGFLEQAQHEMKYSSLLLMGSSSIECVEEFRAEHNAPAPAWQQYTTHSLSEVLALPELKRSVWQQLLPLHAWLSRQAH